MIENNSTSIETLTVGTGVTSTLDHAQHHATAVPLVALVAAVQDELLPTIKLLGLEPDQPWFTGSVGRQHVVAAFTGVGANRAIEVFSTLLDEHRPQRVIHLGFAGGLNPKLNVGKVLRARWVINGQGQVVRLDNKLPELVADDPTLRPVSQTLLTMGKLVDSPAEKKKLFAQHRAAAVDMETFHIAKLAAQRKIPLTILRAISDPADMSIPPEALGWVHPDGTDNILAAITHLATRPWKIPRTVRLGRNAKLAGRNLAQEVQKLLNAR